MRACSGNPGCPDSKDYQGYSGGRVVPSKEGIKIKGLRTVSLTVRNPLIIIARWCIIWFILCLKNP